MTRLTTTGLPPLSPEDDSSGIDWSGSSVVGAPATVEDRSIDWSGSSEVEPSQPRNNLSPEDVLRMINSDPEKARAIFESIKNKSEKSFSQKVNDNIGPLGRGMRAAGEETGRSIVNGMMRGLSYIPGLEGLSDHANHMNRLAAIQAAYDDYLSETGLTADLLTPAGAKLLGGVTQASAQALLTGGAGKLAGLKSPRGFTAWFAATHGGMEAERSLTVAEDAGLEGISKNAYATGMGGLTGTLTLLGGLAGEKLGAFTTEEVISRGASRALSGLMTRQGLKAELIGAALEGSEEEIIALTQSLYGGMFGMDTFDQYKDNIGQAFIAGAATRGVLGAGQRLRTKFMDAANRVPDTIEGFLDAQQVEEGVKSVDSPDIVTKSENPDYKVAFDEERKTLKSLKTEYTRDLESVRQERTRLEQQVGELAKSGTDQAKLDETFQALQDAYEKESSTRKKLKEAKAKLSGLPPGEVAEIQKEIDALKKELKPRVLTARRLQARVFREEQKGPADPTKVSESAVEMFAARKKAGETQKLLKEAKAELELARERLNKLKEKESTITKQITEDPARVSSNLTRLDNTIRSELLESDKSEIMSARQVDLDRDRVRFNLAELPPQQQVSHLESLHSARAKGIPSRAMEIAVDSLAKKSVWDTDTTMGVMDAYHKTVEAAVENRKLIAERPEHVSLDSVLATDSELMGKIDVLSAAVHRSGSEEGRAFRARQFRFVGEADPAAALLRARRSKGENLTKEEADNVLDKSERVAKLKKELLDIDPDSPAHKEKAYEIFIASKDLEHAEAVPGRRSFVSAMGAGTKIWHGLLTTLDLSAVGVQSGLPLISNPVLTVKALAGGIQAGLTKERALRYEFGLMQRPNADLYKRGLVTLYREDTPFDTLEDMAVRSIKSRWGALEPLKNFLNVWPRFYRTMINGVRADLFDALVATNGGRGAFKDFELEQLGSVVDTFTGRGGRGYADKFMPGASIAMFAPRFTLSQIESVTLAPIWRSNEKTRGIAARQYGRMAASWLTLYALGAVANMFSNAADEDDVVEVDLDPTSPAFLRMKFGDVVLDPTFRYGRYLSVLGQTVSQARKLFSSDEAFVKAFERDDKSDEGRSVLAFLRGKLNLPPGAFVDLVTGKNIKGENITPTSILVDRATPISTQQLTGSIEAWGVPKGAAVGAAQFFGFGVGEDYRAARDRRSFFRDFQ